MPEVADAQRVAVGALDDLPLKEFRYISVGRVEIGVIRLPDGSVHAVRNVCPHKGAPVCRGDVSGTMVPSAPGELSYGLEDTVLRCPWHGFEFSLQSGEELFTGHGLRLARYAVTVDDDGVVYVDARRPIRPAGD